MGYLLFLVLYGGGKQNKIIRALPVFFSTI